MRLTDDGELDHAHLHRRRITEVRSSVSKRQAANTQRCSVAFHDVFLTTAVRQSVVEIDHVTSLEQVPDKAPEYDVIRDAVQRHWRIYDGNSF